MKFGVLREPVKDSFHSKRIQYNFEKPVQRSGKITLTMKGDFSKLDESERVIRVPSVFPFKNIPKRAKHELEDGPDFLKTSLHFLDEEGKKTSHVGYLRKELWSASTYLEIVSKKIQEATSLIVSLKSSNESYLKKLAQDLTKVQIKAEIKGRTLLMPFHNSENSSADDFYQKISDILLYASKLKIS